MGSEVMMSYLARVVINNFRARIADYVVVLFSEYLSRVGRNQRFDFADRDVLDFRMHYESSGCDASAATNDKNILRIGMKERGQVAQQALEAHVLGLGAGFHLAAHVKVRADAVPP